MPLSVFSDALPYTFIRKYYGDFLSSGQQTAPLRPNIGYSSNLHWQLYCNLYPDDIGFFTDWSYVPEKRKSVVVASKLLQFTDSLGDFGMLTKKALDHYIARDLCFANVPYRFRPYFSIGCRYLFWDRENFEKYDIFKGYTVISQDVNGGDFETTVRAAEKAISEKKQNLFLAFGFADGLGHRYCRDSHYDNAVHPYMKRLKDVTDAYAAAFPEEEILLLSDHGMHTVNDSVTVDLTPRFGKQTRKTYFAYIDSCIMRVYCPDRSFLAPISAFLSETSAGHLLSEEERLYYGVTDRNFGDLIFNLQEGITFDHNWFGYALRKENRVGIAGNGIGMHGFWPAETVTDHTAVVMLKSASRTLSDGLYSYRDANALVNGVLRGRNGEAQE